MMNDHEGDVDDRDLALALRRLGDAAVVPPSGPGARGGADGGVRRGAARRRRGGPSGRQYWYMAGLATAAALLIAVGLRSGPDWASRDPSRRRSGLAKAVASASPWRPAGPQPPDEFVMVPGPRRCPPMESGSLVRMDVPVAMLPSLGLMPPQTNPDDIGAGGFDCRPGRIARAARLVIDLKLD